MSFADFKRLVAHHPETAMCEEEIVAHAIELRKNVTMLVERLDAVRAFCLDQQFHPGVVCAEDVLTIIDTGRAPS